jgi:hypothetical protein
MSMGAKPSTPPPPPPAPPPPAPAPDAPVVGDRMNGKRGTDAKRRGTSALRSDLMIVPGAAGLGGASLNTGAP